MAKELLAVEGRLQACSDVAALRRAGMQHAATMGQCVQVILAGSTDPDPCQHGMTTEEERSASQTPQVMPTSLYVSHTQPMGATS